MRASWAQPSLSRDFALLSGAILALLLLLSAWVAWVTYTTHSKRIIEELEKEASRIDRTLEREIENANYLLNALGQNIAKGSPSDLRALAELLRSFESHNPVNAVWSWMDITHQIVVSSNKGILDPPVNVADRDYIQKSESDPWQIQIGRPIQGRVSGKWVIPIGMGLTDPTGKFLGTLVASIDISALTERISHLVKREGISFAIVSQTFMPLTVVSDNPDFMRDHFPPGTFSRLDVKRQPSGIVSQASLFTRDRIYSYYQVSLRYPYVILVGYDSKYSDNVIKSQLWPRLVQIVALASFLLLFLWIVRMRIITPVVGLTDIAARVARGETYAPMVSAGPVEIEMLARQISHISDYIAERRRVEEELRAKLEEMLIQRERQRSATDDE